MTNPFNDDEERESPYNWFDAFMDWMVLVFLIAALGISVLMACGGWR